MLGQMLRAAALGLVSLLVADYDRTNSAKLERHETELLADINRQRQLHGLSPLTVDAWLQNSARWHAAWMARNQTLTHTSQAVAENIAMGQRTGAQAVQDWMNSPGHRANILGTHYTRIGVAGYTSSSGVCYWCMQLLP